ncbi:uncharacterized protein LOC124920895 [Impatiens glandulifera]|uniref:uncharacterized protein LOC124920895 n=1 Tax=Impatiens glandulifera TaxID=253017 RepID=UPI001FB19879|nr:uncharacterized protein LOC124920895 [Impatiens glandulifera]
MEGGPILKLIVEKDNREKQTLEFQPGSVVKIGRFVRGNTLVIKDSGISSKHLSIEFVSGEWILSDLGSSNGTFVNGEVIDVGTSIKLGDGDAIKIGELTSIEVRIEVQNVGCSTLRRNPRRRAVKDSEQYSVGISGVRSRRGGELASTAGKKELGLGLAVGGEGKVRRGRPRKVVAQTDDSQESFHAVVEVGNGQKTKSSLLPPLSSTVDVCSALEEEGFSAEIVQKETRGRRGRKRKVDVDPPLIVRNEVIAEKCSLKNSQIGKEDDEEEEGVSAEILQKETSGGREKRKRKVDVDPPLIVRNEAIVENCSLKDSQIGKEDAEEENQRDVEAAEEEGVSAATVQKETRGRGGRKKKVNDDPPLIVRNEVIVEKCSLKDSQIGKEEGVSAEIVQKETRGRRGRKGKVDDDPPLIIRNEVIVEKCSLKDSQIGKDDEENQMDVEAAEEEEGVSAEIVQKETSGGREKRKRKVDVDPPLIVRNEAIVENCSLKDSQIGKEDAEEENQRDVEAAEEEGVSAATVQKETRGRGGRKKKVNDDPPLIVRNEVIVEKCSLKDSQIGKEEGVSAEIVQKETRGRRGRKGKVDDDPPLIIRNEVIVEKCSLKDSQIGKDDEENQMDVEAAEEEEGVSAEIVQKETSGGREKRKRKVDDDPPLIVRNEAIAEKCILKDSQIGKEDDEEGNQMDVEAAEEEGVSAATVQKETRGRGGRKKKVNDDPPLIVRNEVIVEKCSLKDSQIGKEEGVSAEIVQKETRGRRGRKGKVDDDPPLIIRNEVIVEKCSLKDSQIGKDDEENQMDVEAAEEEEGVSAEIVQKETSGGREKRKRKVDDDPPLIVRNEVIAEKCILKDSQIGKEDDEEGNQMDVEAAEEEVEPDLEKMTLGQWFDYMEVYLPKQIKDATVEKISNIKAKAARFNEFMLQQKNEKQKGDNLSFAVSK